MYVAVITAIIVDGSLFERSVPFYDSFHNTKKFYLPI